MCDIILVGCCVIDNNKKTQARQQNSTNNVFHTNFHIIFAFCLFHWSVVIMYHTIKKCIHNRGDENNSEKENSITDLLFGDFDNRWYIIKTRNRLLKKRVFPSSSFSFFKFSKISQTGQSEFGTQFPACPVDRLMHHHHFHLLLQRWWWIVKSMVVYLYRLLQLWIDN